MTEVILIENT